MIALTVLILLSLTKTLTLTLTLLTLSLHWTNLDLALMIETLSGLTGRDIVSNLTSSHMRAVDRSLV
ncbi:MAG: hypothetical protein AB7V06_27045 [Candidatus Obscuribacterales bacterium]